MDPETQKLLPSFDVNRAYSSNLLSEQFKPIQVQSKSLTSSSGTFQVLSTSDLVMSQSVVSSMSSFDPREETLEEKLFILAGESNLKDMTSSGKASKDSGRHFTKLSLLQMLVQGLTSKDEVLLQKVLNTKKGSIIKNTVSRLPTRLVLPFMEVLLGNLTTSSHQQQTNFVSWMRILLSIHMSYLMTVPDVVERLGGLYQTMEARVGTFEKLMKLSGRLDMILTTANLQNVSLKSSDPNFVYVESGK